VGGAAGGDAGRLQVIEDGKHLLQEAQQRGEGLVLGLLLDARPGLLHPLAKRPGLYRRVLSSAEGPLVFAVLLSFRPGSKYGRTVGGGTARSTHA
jgi:hypothetical protein